MLVILSRPQCFNISSYSSWQVKKDITDVSWLLSTFQTNILHAEYIFAH